MAFDPVWTDEACEQFEALQAKALASCQKRQKDKSAKSSKVEGLFKQVERTIKFLLSNPRHPGLHTHPYSSIEHPYSCRDKVYEAYAQNKTPGAYRVFWCYGPEKNDITIIAITPHP